MLSWWFKNSTLRWSLGTHSKFAFVSKAATIHCFAWLSVPGSTELAYPDFAANMSWNWFLSHFLLPEWYAGGPTLKLIQAPICKYWTTGIFFHWFTYEGILKLSKSVFEEALVSIIWRTLKLNTYRFLDILKMIWPWKLFICAQEWLKKSFDQDLHPIF